MGQKNQIQHHHGRCERAMVKREPGGVKEKPIRLGYRGGRSSIQKLERGEDAGKLESRHEAQDHSYPPTHLEDSLFALRITNEIPGEIEEAQQVADLPKRFFIV